jgi:hypothetical protein
MIEVGTNECYITRLRHGGREMAAEAPSGT